MPNILASPRSWDKKALILKAESGGYGVDAVPTGAANYIEARNVSLTSADPETVERNIVMPAFGKGGSLITSIWAKLSFDYALVGSGALGTAPKFSPIMLACGFSETIVAATSVTYNLISAAFGSCSGYMNIDGVLYKFIGSRGNQKFSLSAKGIPMVNVELQSVYLTPADSAMPTLTKTGWTVEDPVNSVNTGYLTVNGVNLAFSQFDVDIGNKISRVDLPGPQREVAITGRSPTASATVLAPTLAVFNPYALFEANTAIVVSNTHGITNGKKAKQDLKCKISGVTEDQVEGMAAYKLSFSPEQVAGNDEYTLTML